MMPTYINYKDLLGIIQELYFQVQHPRARGWCVAGTAVLAV